MPIATKTEIKTLLQISGSAYDTLIDALIPAVQDFIVQYCNNNFINKNIYLNGSSISFIHNAETADTIMDEDENFVEALFADGMDILVEGSYNNDGMYLVGTVAAGTLTLDTGETLVTEDEGTAIRITRVVFPKALKLPFSKLIQFDLAKRDKSITSFRLGDYSESYAGDGDYPPGLLKSLVFFRKLYND
jgi:hypothetical protein